MDSEKDVRAPERISGNGTRAAGSIAPPSADVPGAPVRRAHPSDSQSVRPTSDGLPVWMQRLFLVIFVILCIEVGIVLVAVPWLPIWSDNGLLMNFPNVKAFMRLGFVRGIVTGLGLLDIWIGIWEAVHYRDRKTA